ncbi:TetR/AcrR family transcriptional regulator [Streptomyces atroolivaceus]|uniref:TetR/AcrR family transcriptional regulator n=1 Tax=Streptomyces atroolivaceus TaxID=66869 RepID=A0ABV9VFF5_STRAZ|nr:TetR/AcrR family transcriptional regulator [Streptomyces atroolivaceus]
MSNGEVQPRSHPVPQEIVDAALRAAEIRGAPVADVPVLAIAQEAGVSRSTLMRRLGGTRRTLDEAVRGAGVDPGGRKPVRERAVEAAAALISERGLDAVTFELVAGSARCSVHSLYAVFGSRDELLDTVFERYSPVLAVEDVLAGPREEFDATVRRIHRLLAEALSREPRVMPALFAQALARPGDDSVQAMFRRNYPRLITGIGTWLSEETAAGRIRDLPPILLIQQLTSPVVFHFLMRPAIGPVAGADMPDTGETLETFTQNFLRAVAVTPPCGN